MIKLVYIFTWNPTYNNLFFIIYIKHIIEIAGFVAIGCEYAFATAASASIHGALAPQTTPVAHPSYTYRNMWACR